MLVCTERGLESLVREFWTRFLVHYGSEKAILKPDSNRQKAPKNFESITDRPDDWLLRQWKTGNEHAAEVFFDRYAIRMVALVASRLNRRYRSTIDPDEVVQSAMGSFFEAARHSRIEVSGSVSLWRLLATFARRKMARSIERHSATKRGGEFERISLDEAESPVVSHDGFAEEDEAGELLRLLKMELSEDLVSIVEGLLVGQTQRELASSLGIDERTVRRRTVRIREQLADVVNLAKNPSGTTASLTRSTSVVTTLPRVNYNEFVLGKLIGVGGFGKVYRASMQSDGRTVAVKFLRKAFWQNEDARASFLREINLASQIKHPGIIRHVGYGESPHGGPYLLSEWIDGQSLHTVKSPSSERFTGWLIQICQALEAVHKAGLVHGDLTPSNILVDKQDRITITDFGFSQASSKNEASIPGGTPFIGGTVGFAAPEQIDQSFGNISVKTDIYAIGGLLHWNLLGLPPNVGVSVEEAIARTLSSERLESSNVHTVSPSFRDLLFATLRKSPSDRTIRIPEIIDQLARTLS